MSFGSVQQSLSILSYMYLYFCGGFWESFLSSFSFLQLSNSLSLEHINLFSQSINSLCQPVYQKIL